MTTNTTLIKQLREETYASYVDCAEALKQSNGDFDRALKHLRAINMEDAERKADRDTEEGLIVVKRAGQTACALRMECETDFVALTREFKAFAHQLTDEILANPLLTDADSTLGATFAATGQPIVESLKELAGKLSENVVLTQVARYEAAPGHIVEAFVHAGAIDGYGEAEGRMGVLVELATAPDVAVAHAEELRSLAHDLALHIISAQPSVIAREAVPTEEVTHKRAFFQDQLSEMNKPEAIKAKIMEGKLNKFYQQTCLLEQAYIKDEDLTVAQMLHQQGERWGAPVRVTRFVRMELETA